MTTETLNHAAPLMPLQQRDLEALEEIFANLDADQLAQVEANASYQFVLPLAPWEEVGLEI